MGDLLSAGLLATLTWLGGCSGLQQGPRLGPQSFCHRALALWPGFRAGPLGIVSAALHWQRSGFRRTLRSSDPPPGARSPAGPSGAPGSLRRSNEQVTNEKTEEWDVSSKTTSSVLIIKWDKRTKKSLEAPTQQMFLCTFYTEKEGGTPLDPPGWSEERNLLDSLLDLLLL